MELPLYLAMVFTISLSGVLSPGPLFAATLSEGLKNPFSGFKISAGHAIVEVPLIVVLYLAGFYLTEELKAAISLAGGVFLLYLAYEELKEKEVKRISGTLTGIVLTILNPYFIVWWLTIGFSLITLSYAFGLAGLILFIVVHELTDFGWLGFVSFSSHKLSKKVSFAKKLRVVSAAIFVVFGTYFVTNSVLYFFA